ncbi:OTU domain [Dillenia turbinata]|uniref:Ubiquitin thioesterase OTU n=1 Tax=Dillenia turbinata TaxID=194707 RepID=A0AAN8W222_9MAGN
MAMHPPITTSVRRIIQLSRCIPQQMNRQICSVLSKASSPSCFVCIYSTHSKAKSARILFPRTLSSPSNISFQAYIGSCLRSSFSKQRDCCPSLMVKSLKSSGESQRSSINISLGARNMEARILTPKQGSLPKIICNVGPISWPQRSAALGLLCGLLICYSSYEPVHADAAPDSGGTKDRHGKRVYTDYSVTGIPGDGRCLFRSVAHGACLRSGKPAPNESIQRELADDLRARVADEFIKRRVETEWLQADGLCNDIIPRFIEGDFDAYVSQMRKPHVWGGEPELFIASHVLQMPITVYMYDEESKGLISIAEYGQEYGKEDPIRVLYHGFGHYDALQLPGKKGPKSRL